MKKTNTLIFLALIVVFLGSCTVERRLHNKGFHVQWSKKYKADKSKVSNDQELAVHSDDQESVELESTNIVASNSEVVPEVFDNQPEVDRIDVEQEDEVFEHVFESTITSSNTETVVEPVIEQKAQVQSEKKATKKSKKASAASSGKRQMIALLLVIFVGLLGVHRFYLGYTGVGVLMVLTLGLFGILTLIDLIRIAVGDLKPKRGEYSETLNDLMEE